MRTISGGLGGGLLGPIGMFIFTACVWIGMVMISMIKSTSITSISGVVLMSTITSSSGAEPTFIAMACSLLRCRVRWRLGDEPDLGDARALAGHHQAAHRFVARFLVAADVQLGLRLFHRFLLQRLD